MEFKDVFVYLGLERRGMFLVFKKSERYGQRECEGHSGRENVIEESKSERKAKYECVSFCERERDKKSVCVKERERERERRKSVFAKESNRRKSGRGRGREK
jgi:hypothetical protein